MLNELQRAIVSYIEKNDPSNQIVKIDVNNQTISYNNEIRCHQTPKYEYEGFVRAYLILRLVKELNYPMDCIEIENDLNVNVGRTKKHKGIDRRRSDIIVFQKTTEGKEKLFLGIECKVPEEFNKASVDIDGQLWGITKASSIEARVKKEDIKYLVLYTCELIGGEIHDKPIVIDYQNFQTYNDWKTGGQISSNAIPEQYGDAPQSQYVNVLVATSDQKPLNKKLTKDDFVKLRVKLHNLLWAGSSTDDNAIFYQLVKIFLVKIYDELYTNTDEAYQVQIRTSSEGEETAENLYSRLEKLYFSACRELLNYDDMKLQEFPFRVEGFTAQKLKIAIREIQSVSLTENESTADGFDVLGAFFEGILTNQEFFKQSKSCFFTHQNIVQFMIAMLDLDNLALRLLQEPKPRLPYIIDPSCGSGTFLIQAMNYISSRVRSRQSEIKFNKVNREFFASAFQHVTKPNIWAADFIYGIEPRPELGLAAKVNMILHGDGNMNVFIEDGLHSFDHPRYSRRWKEKNEGILAVYGPSSVYENFNVNEQFDVILTNPPFSLETDGLDSSSTHRDNFLYHSFANSENLFIERYYQLLREGGRLAVVLPESVFDTSENKYIRLFIYKYFNVDAIISLPQEAFAPYTTTKTSLLFATKKSNSEVSKYDAAWNKATVKYGKLRSSNVVQRVLENDRLLNSKVGLLKICSELEVDVAPTKNLLDENLLTKELVQQLSDKINALPVVSKKEKENKKTIEDKLSNIIKFVESKPFDNLDNDKDVAILKDFLRDYFPDKIKSAKQVCELSYDEVITIADLDWPGYGNKTTYANSWWCFAEVSNNPILNYEIFFAETENIGYKRTKRGEQERVNELYQKSEEDGFPIINSETLITILDKYWAFRSGGGTGE